MTERERGILSHIYGCLNAMSGLEPPNPADIGAKSRNLHVSAAAASCLAQAVFNLVAGEYPQAGAQVARAQRDLEAVIPVVAPLHRIVRDMAEKHGGEE